MTINYAALQATLNRTFEEPLFDLVNRSHPVLAGLQKKAVASDQIYLKNQMASSHEAGAVADGATITVGTPATTYSAAILPWSTYKATFKVNKRVMAQVASNPGQLGNIFKTEVMNAGKDLANLIGSDIFAGSVANGLVGLQAMVDDGNTYAGIDRSVAGNANWRSTVLDLDNAGATQELSTTFLNTLEGNYYDAVGYGWDTQPGKFTGVTNSAIMNKYRALMESIDLSSLSTAHFVNQANNSGQLGIGKTGYMGVPFMRDRNVSAAGDLADSGRLYFLNMNMIHLCVLDPTAGDANIHQVQGYTAAPDTTGIKTQIEILANTGEFVAGYVKAYVQLATPNPKEAGSLMKNITAV